MGTTKYRIASDGLPARLAPTWTEEKLRILECYLGGGSRGFAGACKRHPSGWFLLDTFAGAGMNISETTNAEIPGSALLALNAGPPGAKKVILCENGPKTKAALAARVGPFGDRVALFDQDANAQIAEMLALIPKRAPAFAFLDPEGAELAWKTVQAIARHKFSNQTKIEQLILLPTDTGFVRMLSLDKPLDPEYARRVTAMFGTDEWRPIYDGRRAGKLSAEDARHQYVALYAQQLSRLGYKHVQERQLRKEGKGGAPGSPMYFLLHASDHPAGERIMDHCFNKKHVRPGEEAGQVQMFPTPVAPRRRVTAKQSP
jgi:three-Cys-motif partner protein